jgi:TRAP-type mannitol/chloroaromatic compound transport system permease small subunit
MATAMTSASSSPRPTPPRPYLAVIRTIDRFTEWTGHIFVLFIIPLVLANVFEVFARYFLKSPTIWALDITTMSYAALFMLGSALALLKGAHVRTDMLWEGFSDRTKGMIDSLAFILFFLPTMAVLFWISIDDFFYSMSINERSNTTSWQPILWPLRGVIPLACLLLFIQGISEVMKSLWAARTGDFLVHQEKLEL